MRDVEARGIVTAPPPCGAYCAGVVFGDIVLVDRPELVGVAGDDVYIAADQIRLESGGVLEGVGAGLAVHRGVHGKDDRRARADMLKVFGKP